jgi:BioD-like phosphotransacetylase family protein
MNASTPRVFVAATRQNEGKTTISLGLMSLLQQTYPRIGFIKPVGQRFIEVQSWKIDEDTVLMDRIFHLDCPLVDMSPIAVEPDFTRKYIESSNRDLLVTRIEKAFDRVAWEKDFVLCEGSGHAGVGAVFDLSNAQVAAILKARVILVTQGGIGKPIDEIVLNQTLFEKEGVEVIGVILNKVLPSKVADISEIVRRGLRRKGIELLGVVPQERILSSPTVDLIREELHAEMLNHSTSLQTLVRDIVVGAMGVNNVGQFLKPGVLLITPGDREDILLATATLVGDGTGPQLAGIILTGNLRPDESVLGVIRKLPFPVLLAGQDSYEVASRVHVMTVKTRPDDAKKISIIRNLIAQHVDVDKILKAL